MDRIIQVLSHGLLLMYVIFVWSAAATAADRGEGRDPLPIPPKTITFDRSSSQSIAFDNDVFVPGARDQDYTYGINLTLVGDGVEDHWLSTHSPLAWLDRTIGIDQYIGQNLQSSKIEYGLFGFTPENLSVERPEDGDRPYASLVYVSSTRERYEPAREVSWQTTLTVGVLGLPIVGEIQDAVHSVIDGEDPQGWDTQISEGGELTARYSVARQRLLYQSRSGMEIKSTVQGSIGYISEASWSLSMRAGNIQTPWVSFNPELASYGEKSTPTDHGWVSEQYFWTGFSLKARAYNAFLQGQFKDSEISYDSDELNHGIVEAWIGYTVALNSGYTFTYSIRGHTSELKDGVGDRSVLWGGLLVTKTIK